MREKEQFQRKGILNRENTPPPPAKNRTNEPVKNSGLIGRDLTFSEFMLASPLAGSELSFPRDFNDERYIQIQL